MLIECAVVAVGLVLGMGSVGDPPGSPLAPPPAAHPAVFTDKTYDEALAAIKGTDKVLIVKATAAWCGPCKAMNRTTFSDAKVVEWIGGHGLAIEFDVDQQPDLAKKLNITAMPTTILYKQDREFDRIVGFRDAAGFLEWVEQARAGKRAGDDLAARIEKARKGEGKVSMQDHMKHARNLVTAGRLDAATEEYLWLWENIVKQEPAMIGVRGSFLAGEIGALTRSYPPARRAFSEIRDQAEARLKGDNKSWDDLDDWIVLNEQLDDEARTLAWFDRIKTQEGADQTIDRFSYRIERLLEDNDRLADLGRMQKKPLAKLRQKHAVYAFMPAMGDKERDAMLKKMNEDSFRREAATLYTSLLTAHREDDAEAVAAESVKFDGSAEMRFSLVQKAAANKAARPIHLEWLKGAENQDGYDDLKADVEKQVGNVN